MHLANKPHVNNMIDGKYEYFAFISYRWEDEKMAKWLQEKLEHYKLPTSLREQNPNLPTHIRPIFRDKTDLNGHTLEESLMSALESSRYLIVICSPLATQSEWVNRGIQKFIDLGREKDIIPFIIDGEANADDPKNECFPPALRSLKGERAIYGININDNGRDAAAVKVVSRMFDVKYDTLWNRFLLEQKKRRRYTIAGLVAAILVVVGVAGYIWTQNQELDKRNVQIETQYKELQAKNAQIEQQNKDLDAKSDSITKVNTALIAAKDSIQRAYEKLDLSEKNLSKANANLKESNILLAVERDNVLKSNHELICSQTRAVAKEANNLIEEGNLVMAVKLLLNVVPNKNNNYKWPYIAEAEAALRRAVDSLNVNYWHQEMILEHNLQITSANFSPDDRYIVTSSNDNTAKLWDSHTGSLVFSPFVHDRLVNCALFTPDGESIITGCRDKKARMFSIQNASLQQEYDIKGNVWSMAINPISNDLLCYSNSGLSFWDYLSGNNKYWFGSSSRLGKESFANDGRFSWCVGNRLMIVKDNSVLDKISSEFAKYKEEEDLNEESIINFLRHNTQYIEMEGDHESKYSGISKSGDYAYVVTWDSIARLYDTNEETLLRVQNNVHYASLSPNNDYWVTAGVDGNCMVYSVIDNEPLDLEICHESDVVYCTFSPDGQYLVTTSLDRTAKIWNVWEDWHLEATLRHERPVTEAVFSNSSDCLITIQNNNIAKVWRTPAEYNHQVALLMKNAFPSMVSFNKSSNIMLLPSLDRSVLAWDVVANEEVFRSKYYKSVASHAEFSHDSQRVAVSFNNGTARILNAVNGSDNGILLRHQDDINSISFSPNDKYIVTASSDSTAIVWDAVTGEKVSREMQHSFKVRKALFANNSNVITISADSIYLWSSSGQILSKGTTNRTSIEDFDVSFDGKQIAVCDDNNNIMIYDTNHLERKPRLWTHGGIEMPQNGLYLDYRTEIEQEDTTWLNSTISGSNLGKEMYRLLSHKSPVNSVSFSEDGTKIISSSENTIKVWDVATGVLISNNMKHPWRIQYSNVSPNSKYIVSVNNDNKESLLSVWKYLPFKDLIENTIQRFKSFMLNDEEKLRYNLP